MLIITFLWYQVFQDIVLPMNQLEEQIDVCEELFDLYPVLIYPCRVYNHGPHRWVAWSIHVSPFLLTLHVYIYWKKDCKGMQWNLEPLKCFPLNGLTYFDCKSLKRELFC